MAVKEQGGKYIFRNIKEVVSPLKSKKEVKPTDRFKELMREAKERVLKVKKKKKSPPVKERSGFDLRQMKEFKRVIEELARRSKVPGEISYHDLGLAFYVVQVFTAYPKNYAQVTNDDYLT